MININYIQCQRALSITGIQIADYVINPYRGCAFGCAYCYSQQNKCFKKRGQEWGSFVDIKNGLISMLRVELKEERNKISRVLLGSTTEVYQPVEEREKITREILQILTDHNIPATILTKSCLIMRDIDVLKSNPDNKICLTINSPSVIELFEKETPSLNERLAVIERLNMEGINAYAHIGPLFPYITEIDKLMELCYRKTSRVNFEGINIMMIDKNKIEFILAARRPELMIKVMKVFSSEEECVKFQVINKNKVNELNRKYNFKSNMFFYSKNQYFNNKVT